MNTTRKLGLIGCEALVAGSILIGCTSGCTTATSSTGAQFSTLDTNAVISGINLVVPAAVRLAEAKDTNTVAYFQQAVIVLKTLSASGTVDPAMVRSSLENISIRELRNENAALAEEAGLALYQSFAAQVVLQQENKVVWLQPVLAALASALEAGLSP